MPKNPLLDQIFARIKLGNSPLQALQGCMPYMLYRRIATRFTLLEKHGYPDAKFEYSFLKKNSSILKDLTQKGYVCLPLSPEEASLEHAYLWVLSDNSQEPRYLLFVEAPDESDLALNLCLLLNLEICHRKNAVGLENKALAPWAKESSGHFEKKNWENSPMLILAERGSQIDHFVQYALKKNFDYHYHEGSIHFFHPSRFSAKIQLQELLGHLNIKNFATDPQKHIAQSLTEIESSAQAHRYLKRAIVIQEAGDIKPKVQKYLLSYFQCMQELRDDHLEKKKLWIFESSCDLEKMVDAGKFLPQLYALLEKNKLLIKPLRYYKDKIIDEALRLLHILQLKHRKHIELELKAQQSLVAYDWPGNWQEFEQVLTFAFFTAKEASITVQDLHFAHKATSADWDDFNLRKHLAYTEKELLLQVYSMHQGNQMQMAHTLGISRGSLQYKLRRHGIYGILVSNLGRATKFKRTKAGRIYDICYK